MGDTWDWTDATCMLISTTIALVVTIWFWKKGLLHYVIKGVNTTVDQRPEKTKSVVQLEKLESIADVLLRTDQTLQPVTLHNKVLTDLDLEAWQKDKSLPLRAYLQGMTSKRRHLLESALTISARELVRLMDSSYSKPKEFSEILSSCIFNFTCRIAFGTNCDLDPSWKTQVKAVVEKWPDCESTASKLPEESLKDKHDEFKSAKEKLENSFKELIKSRKQNSDDVNQESYIDYFFANNCEDKSYDLLAKQLISLFLCCGESTTKYLLTALEFIADNPGVQGKMQAEFVNVAPEENLITLWLENRQKVRFSEAVLKEILRLSTPVPVFMGLSNSAPESDGAEEKLFVANFKAVLEDTNQWKQAGEFIPTRFLDDEKKEAFVPFSLGENSCPGEEFFMATCFVILSSVLRKFQLKRRQQPLISEDGEESPIRESSSVYVTERVEYEE